MSIERDGKEYVATCDYCGDTLEPEYDFYDAVNAKKNAGWISKKEFGEWNDICLECQERGKA